MAAASRRPLLRGRTAAAARQRLALDAAVVLVGDGLTERGRFGAQRAARVRGVVVVEHANGGGGVAAGDGFARVGEGAGFFFAFGQRDAGYDGWTSGSWRQRRRNGRDRNGARG